MYSSFQLAKKYLHYFINAASRKGHGIHSPFVYDFIAHVLNDKKKYECYSQVEPLRNQLRRDDNIIEVEDFGAGSALMPARKRRISSIAKSSLKNKKFTKLIFRVANYYKPKTIIELGTSFGITSCYMACATQKPEIFTLEGSREIARIAQKNFAKLHLQNIHLIQGSFDDTFLNTLNKIEKVDLAFVDGNHRKEPTLQYFFALIKKASAGTVFIFDDIHWSAEMEEAWAEIQQHPAVTLTIDLFFIGLVFFSPDFKEKQHFTIRF
jgi:predicted O-methyltransferase YrrM